MKILNFTISGTDEIRFGVLINNVVVSFDTLQKTFVTSYEHLSDIQTYLENFPESEKSAKSLLISAEKSFSQIADEEKFDSDQINILPPVPEPPAMFDFALSPEHLKNSALTMIKYEKKWPTSSFLKMMIKAGYKKSKNEKDFKYYKCNHNSIIGDGDSTIWPAYSYYLDIEPELAIVTGKTGLNMTKDDLKSAIAGYTILNDFSARDVQWPEMMAFLGPTRSKDLEKGNGIGPFLVTSDEVSDPLKLNVSVNISDRDEWTGNTSGYNVHPLEIIEYISGFRSLKPGTIIGMGTIPWCCGLDRDEWILPGDKIKITFECLGTLHQTIPSDIKIIDEPRWKSRPELFI